MQWLEAHGPFGVLIDGSNLALYGQNWAHGGFDFAQIGAAYDHAVAQFPALKPLVVRPDAGLRALLRVGEQDHRVTARNQAEEVRNDIRGRYLRTCCG